MLYHIFKWELCYYRATLVSLAFFAMIFITLHLLLNRMLDAVLRVFVFTLPILGICMTRDQRRGKKLRLYTLLPIPTWHMAVLRHAVWLPFWLFLFALLVVVHWIPGAPSLQPPDYRLMLIVMNGIIIMALLVNILADLTYVGRGRREWRLPKSMTVVLVLFAAALYLLTTFSSQMAEYLWAHVINAGVATVSSIVVVLLFAVSVLTLLSRRSFLQ